MNRIFKLEERFDVAFSAELSRREKQIQQNYRPIIGVHKWFARRPGTLFRNLLLAEFNGDDRLQEAFWQSHEMKGVIADPFMGGGTPIFEANRLGFSVVGADINPMAYWVVRQSLAKLDLLAFQETAEKIASEIESDIGHLYTTTCVSCKRPVPVKYFVWVKVSSCPHCGQDNDLFPGFLLAEASRHPRNVLVCAQCGELNEFDRIPTIRKPGVCSACGGKVIVEGVAKNNKTSCRHCGSSFSFPSSQEGPPRHRMWAIEYSCPWCSSRHEGRFFKKPDRDDLKKYGSASRRLAEEWDSLPLPEDEIPDGDETRRLHRWGYSRFLEMFNDRQQLGLGLLLQRITSVEPEEIRHALLTVFSDFLRYQNMLCRYDTFALKCQDIFSVHGFPVGLVQCENNLIGIPNIGSGAFRHFVRKYLRAKEYCRQPFETWQSKGRKKIVPIPGERIEVEFTSKFPKPGSRQAFIKVSPAAKMRLPPNSLDGVFTDPPYFDNVQYAELMDFCFVWLRLALKNQVAGFRVESTRNREELTGNETQGRGLEHFTQGLSEIFCHYASALKAGAPFAFTYHHNDPLAYVPLVVAILDASLDCTATIPSPAEMGASLHIARSSSSVLDSIFVCRKLDSPLQPDPIQTQLGKDACALEKAGIKTTEGDLRCLIAGHIARIAINRLRAGWKKDEPLKRRMELAEAEISKVRQTAAVEKLIDRLKYDPKREVTGEKHKEAV